MAKFATPVAMKVTKEQGKYLLDKLISMGYEEEYRYDEGYIATNWNSIHYAVAIASKKPRRRYIIEEYNPELFLAIAAMTEGDMPIKGEWLYFDKPFKIFQVKVLDTHNNWRSGTISVDNPTGCGNFHKPTIQQLVEHFKISANYKEFVLPKKWKLEVTVENVAAVNKWRASKKKYFIVKPGHAVDQDGHWGLTINTISTENTEITTKQFMEHVYKPTFNKEIPEEFYVKYCEEFTEEFYEALRKWAKQNSTGPEYGLCESYHEFLRKIPLSIARFNFSKTLHRSMSYAYGLDNNTQGVFMTEYTLEQVKELINYKPKTNKNEYKENNCKKEIRGSEQSDVKSSSSEREQVNEDLDRNSSSERGKEIKTRVKRSRNFCERGSFSSSEKIARTRRTSSRIRAEKGDFNF